VGGGIGAFNPALALASFDITLVDDFADPVNSEFPVDGLDVHSRVGVRVVSVDASGPDFAPEPNSYDVVTCIDSIEHWHRSPKASLHKMVGALKPGGTLIVGMPNSVNLRKRITVPFGRGKWSPIDAWYEEPEFRSHVREPDVDDLRYIARDLGLSDVEILGRNWAGMASDNGLIRRLARLGDPLLKLRPTLCSDLYLLGKRPR
jgi:SAM-dependent methyltransferase